MSTVGVFSNAGENVLLFEYPQHPHGTEHILGTLSMLTPSTRRGRQFF